MIILIILINVLAQSNVMSPSQYRIVRKKNSCQHVDFDDEDSAYEEVLDYGPKNMNINIYSNLVHINIKKYNSAWNILLSMN